MGLRKENYLAEHIDVVFPEAYATIRKLHIDGKSGVAEFVIQTSRDKSMSAMPIEVVKVYFEVDRNENPYVTAYKKAKECREDFDFNQDGKMEKMLVKSYFTDWEDDIIEV
jgi:hypothetical protein